MTWPASISATPSGTGNLGGTTPKHTELHTEIKNAIDNIVSEVDTKARLSGGNALAGAQVIGTDPGGSELLRVGGDINIGAGKQLKIGGRAVGAVFNGTADKTVANTGTETSLIPATGVGSATLGANDFGFVGRALEIAICGRYGSKGTPAGNITINIKIGGTTILTTGAHALDPGESNQFWRIVLRLSCRSTGTTGTVMGNTAFEHSAVTTAGSNMQAAPMIMTSPQTINTTISNAVDITAQFSTTDAANTITTTCCLFKWLN